MDPIRSISRREPAVNRVDALPRLRLLTPAEREEQRRMRDALRRERAAKDRRGRADQSS
jgi:hypothetical protein